MSNNSVEALKVAKDVDGLLKLVKSEDLNPDTAVEVCKTLQDLFTTSWACKGKFERLNGCSCLLTLVSPSLPSEVVVASCNAISTICDKDNSQHFKKQFGEANGPKRLVDILKATMSPSLIEAICKTIKSTYTFVIIHEKGNSFMDYHFNLRQFDEAGICQRLATLINLSLVPDVAYIVCCTIAKACERNESEANKTLFGQSGGITGLINIFKTQGLPFLLAFEVCRATGFVLSHHTINQNLFYEGGGCEALTSHISNWYESDSEISEFGSSAIKAAAENNTPNQNRFKQAGAVGILKSIILKYHKDARSIKREAKNALRALGEIVPEEKSSCIVN